MPTYDIVEQGADDTGQNAIDPILGDLVGSDTTIVFPPGTYKLNELVVQSGTDDLELIAPDGARLVPGRSGDNIRWFDVYSNGFVLDGFELDMRNSAVPPFVRMNSSAGDWELRRLITRGKVRAATDTDIGSNNSSDARTYFRLSSAAGTRGLLQDCYFHEGSCEPTEASNRRAILVESSKGALTFNRCWFELWGENTIYAKKPEGKLKILNCFVRNSQVGIRLGGNTDVRNCVSIKDAQHPIQAWSGGSLQRGVNVEATDPANSSQGINTYDGTLTIADSDFYHRYLDSSCGGPITAPTPCQRIDVQRVRISYDSTKNHDAIYTYNGTMNDGTPANLEYFQLEDVHVRNDHNSEYGIYIGQVPDTWGTVSGVIGGSGPQTNSSYIQNHMTINGNPTPPDTTPPLPSPPPLGDIPMMPSQLVRIDNTGNSSETTYQITAGEYVLPAGTDGATITTEWGPDGGPRRPPNSAVATGTVPAGKAYAFYVTGGIVSIETTGPATVTVDGEPYGNATPSVSWANPTDGATVSGTVTLQINATDAEDTVGSLAVEYRIDGGTWNTATWNAGSGYYEGSWDTADVADGVHSLDARATDSDSNVSTTSITVSTENTDNAPTVTWENPTDGATVSGSTTLQIAAGDDRDATGSLTVEWQFDGGAWRSMSYNSTTGYYEDSWDTTAVADADHTLTAQATDSASNTSAASEITVTVSNTGTPPSIDMFIITDRSNPRWNWFRVDWSVSDANGDLSYVSIELLDGSGSVLDSATTNVSGFTAAGSTDVRTTSNAAEVVLTVTDDAENETTDSKIL
ncbi:Ig-like domain-containing protein [Haladaptatus sp. NG-SE-30]